MADGSGFSPAIWTPPPPRVERVTLDGIARFLGDRYGAPIAAWVLDDLRASMSGMHLPPLGWSTCEAIDTVASTNAGGITEGVAWANPSIVENKCVGNFWALGSGAGGGGGRSRATNVVGGGGGGGGSGACASLTGVPLFVLPDALWLLVAPGGPGGAAGANGTAGSHSDITRAVGNFATAADSILTSSSTTAKPGVGGSASAGTGGAAAGVAADTSSLFTGYGQFRAKAGQAGSAAGAVTGAAGVAVTPYGSSLPTTGGTGGGSIATASAVNFAGGAISAAGLFPAIPGGLAAGGNGNQGRDERRPRIFSGGTGGGTFDAGTGGRGGDGGRGGGGGGGGPGITGGRGGDGGHGLIIVVTY